MTDNHSESSRQLSARANSDAQPAPGIADYAPSGVDRSLIRWMLELTPTQRLQVIQDQVNAIEEFKETLDSPINPTYIKT